MHWSLLLLVFLAALFAIPVQRLLVRKLNESQSASPDRNMLWVLESLVVAGVGAMVASALVVLCWTILMLIAQDQHDPPILTFLLYLGGQCYAIPVALVVGLFVHARWRRYRRPGRCAACGYDLTGNRSGRCPECGRVSD